MKKYFLVGIKYEKTAEEGKIVKVSEHYLVDALSFTEAEKLIIEEMQPLISGEFIVDKIQRVKINELFLNESSDKWFKSKVLFISLDEEKGIEKRTACNMYVQANGIKESEANLKEGMNGTMADYEIASITETKILDVFNYAVAFDEASDDGDK